MARRGFFPSLSEGERSFVWALIGTCIAGAMLAYVAVLRLSETYPTSQYEIAFTYWTAIAGFIGAAAGFWSSCKRWFGKPGPSGWAHALIGSIFVSGIGSVVGGSLILPIYGTMFGPLQMIMTMIESPALAIIWFGMLMSAHVLLATWRAERDSIFVGPLAP